MNYKEYCEKSDAVEKAREKLKLGQITTKEFYEKYEGVPTTPIPENFEETIHKMCDYAREEYGVGLKGGKLCIVEYNIFADAPDKVCVVFDTEFHGEADEDYTVFEFPVNIFSDDVACSIFKSDINYAYRRKKELEKIQEKKDEQRAKFRNEYSKQLADERNKRTDVKCWEKLKPEYLKNEVYLVIDSLIKRGFLEKEHRDDYIAYAKIDLI
jgi:hypothetical protein